MHDDFEFKIEKSSNHRMEILGMMDLLREEASAVEAYERTLNTISDEPIYKLLFDFFEDHKMAVNYWERCLDEEIPKEELQASPIWDTFMDSFTENSSIRENKPAFRALIEGELFGLREYESFLKTSFISIGHKNYIENVLLPNQRQHVSSLQAVDSLK